MEMKDVDGLTDKFSKLVDEAYVVKEHDDDKEKKTEGMR